jgi:hypothetical protein
MIEVHDIFVCKPGNASKVAKLFKEAMPDSEVLTDMTGQFHRVIMSAKYESLTGYEQAMEKMKSDEDLNKKMGELFGDFNEMYVSGSREIYKVW